MAASPKPHILLRLVVPGWLGLVSAWLIAEALPRSMPTMEVAMWALPLGVLLGVISYWVLTYRFYWVYPLEDPDE